nr:C45 family peptidase [Mesorhizobium sp. B2-1-8]
MSSPARDEPVVGPRFEQFPRYWAELQGLASGLELRFDDVFLWNCRGDIWAMAPDGCTTVQLPGSPHVIGHNEDGDPDFAGPCALAHVASEGGNAFTAFVYPGSLPGHTFAVTSRGLVQTVNNIRPLAGGAGTPRMVLAELYSTHPVSTRRWRCSDRHRALAPFTSPWRKLETSGFSAWSSPLKPCRPIVSKRRVSIRTI